MDSGENSGQDNGGVSPVDRKHVFVFIYRAQANFRARRRCELCVLCLIAKAQ